MRATRGTWAQVEAGQYIQDLNQKIWRVDRISSDRVRVSDSDGNKVDIIRPDGGRVVRILWPTEEEARYTLASALEARVLYSVDREGQYHVPQVDCMDEAQLSWHLLHFHHLDPQGLDLAAMLKAHAESRDGGVHDHNEER